MCVSCRDVVIQTSTLIFPDFGYWVKNLFEIDILPFNNQNIIRQTIREAKIPITSAHKAAGKAYLVFLIPTLPK